MEEFKSKQLHNFRKSLQPTLSDIIWNRHGYLLNHKYKPTSDEDKFLIDIERISKLSDEEIIKEIEDFICGDMRRAIQTLYCTIKEERPHSNVLGILNRYFYNLYREVYWINGVEVDEEDNITSHKIMVYEWISDNSNKAKYSIGPKINDKEE